MAKFDGLGNAWCRPHGGGAGAWVPVGLMARGQKRPDIVSTLCAECLRDRKRRGCREWRARNLTAQRERERRRRTDPASHAKKIQSMRDWRSRRREKRLTEFRAVNVGYRPGVCAEINGESQFCRVLLEDGSLVTAFRGPRTKGGDWRTHRKGGLRHPVTVGEFVRVAVRLGRTRAGIPFRMAHARTLADFGPDLSTRLLRAWTRFLDEQRGVPLTAQSEFYQFFGRMTARVNEDERRCLTLSRALGGRVLNDHDLAVLAYAREHGMLKEKR